MKIFRNRTVIGVLCILLALVICFGVTPLFSRSASEKAEIVRVTADIKEGDEITAEMVQTVEVGAYNLPSGIMTESSPPSLPLKMPISTIWTAPNRPSRSPSRALPPAFPASWRAATSFPSSWPTTRAWAKP